MRNVIEWIRVSSAEQANDDRASIPSQRASVAKICQQHGLKIVRSFEVADVSGANVLLSPEMAELVQLIKSPDIQGVVAREMSRLLRPENMADFALLQAFVETNTVLYLPDGPLELSSNYGRFMGTIRAAMAGLERSEILDRVWNAKEQKRQRGELAQSHVVLPYGVEYASGTFKYKEPQATLVAQAFRDFLAGKQDYVGLSKPLGVTPRGMHLILRNPIYTGWRVIDKKRDISPAGRYPNVNGRQSDRRKIARAEGEVIRIQVIKEPLVSEADFQLVQQIMDQKQKKHWRSSGERLERFSYKNSLTCSDCHLPIETANQRGDYYRCKSRRLGSHCESRGMRRERIEPQLDHLLTDCLTDTAFLSNCVDTYNADMTTQNSTRDLTAIRKRLDVLETKRGRVMHAYFESLIDRDQRDEEIESVTAEKRALESALKEAEMIEPTDTARLVAAFSHLCDWSLWTVAQKRQVLACLGLDIRVKDYDITAIGVSPNLLSDKVTHRDMGSSRRQA